jgi:integrase
MSKPAKSQRKPVNPVDRIVPGVGRISIRAGRLNPTTRDDLDRAITRAVEVGALDALKQLHGRALSPLEFLDASRKGKLASVQAREPLEPLVTIWAASGGIRESSRERYAQSWKFLYDSLPPRATLDDLTNRWWVQFMATRSKVVGNATINRDRAALLAFYNWAREQGYRLPDLAPKKQEETPKRSEILDPRQLNEIRLRCRPDRWPFFWTLIETGARQGEVLNLTGPDIDPTCAAIRFLPQEGSKGRKPRFVPCSAELHNYLLTLAAISGRDRLFEQSRRTIQEWWKDLCEEAGIEGVTLHGLRATFITRALDRGVPPVQVQKLVGHRDITMTTKYYRNPKESLEAAEQIREAIGLGGRPPAEEEPSAIDRAS